MHEIRISLKLDEVNLILEALGQLPFARVYGLIGSLQEQAGRQINPAPAEPAAVVARPAAVK